MDLTMNSFNNIYNNKKVLVTGHTGFKGSWLTAWLTLLGAKVIGISNAVPTDPSHYNLFSSELIYKDYKEDIRNKEKIRQIFEENKPDFLFHLAAQPIVSISYKDPLETFSVNAIGTATILDILKDWEEELIAVFITSDKCYENVEWIWGYKETDKLGGSDPYSASKACAEIIFSSYSRSILFKKENIKLCSARAGNVIGGGDWSEDRIIVDCVNNWKIGNSVSLRSPKSTRPWQHVLEPLSGYLHLAEKMTNAPELSFESFNFGPKLNVNFSVEELVQDLSEKINLKNKPSKVIEYSNDVSFKEANLLSLNIEKAIRFLGWQPVLNYEETVQFTADWYSYFYESDCREVLTNQQINDYQLKAKSRNLEWT